MGRHSYVGSFASISQAVTEKTNLKVNKGETVRTSADDPQHGEDGRGHRLLVLLWVALETA